MPKSIIITPSLQRRLKELGENIRDLEAACDGLCFCFLYTWPAAGPQRHGDHSQVQESLRGELSSKRNQ